MEAVSGWRLAVSSEQTALALSLCNVTPGGDILGLARHLLHYPLTANR
jgi:hypothetical protein